MELRPVASSDLAFLAEMARFAAFPPGHVPDLPDEPRVTRWFAEWGREGDVGVVAWDDGRRVGAAWCRIQDVVLASDPDGKPLAEVAVAVVPDRRGQGLGTQLIGALAREAHLAGHLALSLTVNAGNPARRLYERADFVLVERDVDRLVMVAKIGL